MSPFTPDEKIDLKQQLLADKTTLEVMLADQREHLERLRAERSNGPWTKVSDVQAWSMLDNYIMALEAALEELNVLVGK